MLPTRAYMREFIRRCERMDAHRRKRTLQCTLTRTQVECEVAARIAQAQARAHTPKTSIVTRVNNRANVRKLHVRKPPAYR